MAERRPPTLRLVAAQVRYQNRVFWRTPIGAVFTLAFPLMFLVLFNLLFHGTIQVAGRDPLTVAQFYAPSLAVFAAASATYTNLTVGTAIARDAGILKRFRGTPLPPWAYLAGRVGSAVWIAVLAVVLMLGVGVAAYGLEVRAAALPAAVVTFGVGAACFAALGVAMAGVAKSGDAAPALANFTILPLAFISDVFLPLDDPPRWLEGVADVFPLKHFARAFQDAFSPFTTGAGFRWSALAVMGVWAAVGAVIALRTFGWEPRAQRAGGRGRRASPSRGR
ncbi:MAG: ABC transporter permease [Actinobacteria bacterium]|nr:ABC transporter permease [Actinomycetota bacterium]